MLNLNDPTVNGSSLTAQQTGLTNSSVGPLSSNSVSGGGFQGANVAANSGIQGIGANGQQGQGSFFRNGDGSYNTDNLSLVLGGVQMLGNLWNSFQQHKIAKEQLGLARETFQTNLENNRQTYNTALEDRIRARHNTEGRAASDTDSYLNEHSL